MPLIAYAPYSASNTEHERRKKTHLSFLGCSIHHFDIVLSVIYLTCGPRQIEIVSKYNREYDLSANWYKYRSMSAVTRISNGHVK